MKLSLALVAAALSQDASPADNKMIHLPGFAPTLPSLSQFFTSVTGDLVSNRCAKDKTLSTHNLNALGNGVTEQDIVDGCNDNEACLFVVRSATEMVQCKGFEEGDLNEHGKTPKESTPASRSLESVNDAIKLMQQCGEEVGSKFQKLQASPQFTTFIKIPSATDLACRNDPNAAHPCLDAVTQKLVDEGVPAEMINNGGVQKTQLLAVDGELALLTSDGNVDNTCFGPKEFESFKSDVLRAVASQPTDEKKARLNAVIVRLAGHDLMDHDVNEGNGGSDGCMLWQDLKGKSTMQDDHDNAGIENAWRVLKPICSKYQISRADCLVLAAEVCITDSSAGKVVFNSKIGRKDAESCDFNAKGPPGTKSRLPPWFNGGGKMPEDANDLLRKRLGVTWTEYVALLGVHNLGGISTVNTGIPQAINFKTSARWKKTWKEAKEFDNNYYRNLLGEKWFQCDKGAAVLLRCDADMHGNGNGFFGIWNVNKADRGPTALGPLANKGKHGAKASMIALSTDMAIASDIYSAGKHEPCPGCHAKDLERAPKAKPTANYGNGDPRREAAKAVVTFAKNADAFYAEFPKVWTKVTENGHLQANLHSIDTFAGKQCGAPKPAAKAAAVAAPKCLHDTGIKCTVTGRCPGGSFAKCIHRVDAQTGEHVGKCLCHKSECMSNGVCSQNPNFDETTGQRGGFSLNTFSADGKLSASSSSSSNAVGATVGFAAAGLFAAAGVVVYLKNRNTAAKQEDVKLTEANLEAL